MPARPYVGEPWSCPSRSRHPEPPFGADESQSRGPAENLLRRILQGATEKVPLAEKEVASARNDGACDRVGKHLVKLVDRTDFAEVVGVPNDDMQGPVVFLEKLPGVPLNGKRRSHHDPVGDGWVLKRSAKPDPASEAIAHQ